MYKTILVTLDNTPTDRAIIDHIKQLAKLMESNVVLLHVATGVPAQFNGPDAVGEEIDEDNLYLAQIQSEFKASDIPAEKVLLYGDPVTEIIKWVNANKCDLVAMSTHGHKLLEDIILGTTAIKVQHNISVPVLLLRSR
jgi:nucleotide-binding universal stress UspA family protein